MSNPKEFIKNGYATVTLTNKDGVTKDEYVHELVALAFIPNPEGKKKVEHIDGNKMNNRADNLRWI